MSSTIADAMKLSAALAEQSAGTSRSIMTVPRVISLRSSKKSWNLTVERCARPNCISPSLVFATDCCRPSRQWANSRHSTLSSTVTLRSVSISTKIGFTACPMFAVVPMSEMERPGACARDGAARYVLAVCHSRKSAWKELPGKSVAVQSRPLAAARITSIAGSVLPAAERSSTALFLFSTISPIPKSRRHESTERSARNLSSRMLSTGVPEEMPRPSTR